MKKAGWTTKRPTGLSVDFTYLKPGKTKKDVRGVDFFVGEIELMAYLDEVDLAELAAAKSAEAKQSAARPVKTKKQAAKATSKLKAIATITVCSTTVSDEASSAAPKPAASRTRALGDVESLPTSALPSSPHRTSRNATPEIILGVSSQATTYAKDDGANEIECENTQEDLPPRRRSLALQFNYADNGSSASDGEPAESGSEGNAPSARGLDGTVEATQGDPNITPETDDPSAYTQFESDGENDEGDDEVSSVDGDDEADMQLPVLPEMQFKSGMVSGLGGIDNISSGEVPDSFLEDMGAQGWSDPVTHTPYDYLMEPYEARSVSDVQADYPNLFTGVSGPTPRALAAATTPMGAFFYFMQPGLWKEIASESNNYFESKLEERVDGQHAKQVAREKKHPEFKRSSKEKIKADLVRAAPITARDLCVFIGLLLARAISPNKEKLANHWRTTDEGAIPHGCFGRYMARDRFMHISRNLHFSPNDAEAAASDRAWKLRPVIDALQTRFQAAFIPPAIMAFDEAMLPSRSTFNRMRVYMKDKPHKWGTKLFMLCCSTTAYCIRFEVYLGKKETAVSTNSTDTKSGPAAVVRNLQHVFGPVAPTTGEMRLVVTDRFYTSVPLSMQLLTMGFYSIGTVRTDRKGLSTKLIPKKQKGDKKKPPKIPKNRPSSIERGTFIVSEALQIQQMRVLRWWDTRAVHMLCTGGSVGFDRIARRDKLSGEQREVACPRVVKDYQTFMGGVDVHDQLRLQRYSLQLCIKYKKYYKSLFLGLVDLAVINSYIIFNAARAARNLPKMSHVKFAKQLHLELTQLREEDWVALQSDGRLQLTPYVSSRAASRRLAEHKPVLNDDWRPGNNNLGRKRRTRACKVCSLLKGTDAVRGGDSSSYCSKCRLQTTSKKPKAWRVFLCDKKRHAWSGELMSCFDIWHRAWRNGTLLPRENTKRQIRARTPAARNENDEGEAPEEEVAVDVQSSDESATDSPAPKRRRRAADDVPTD